MFDKWIINESKVFELKHHCLKIYVAYFMIKYDQFKGI